MAKFFKSLVAVAALSMMIGGAVVAQTQSINVSSEQLRGEIKITVEEAISTYSTIFPDATITKIDLNAELGRYVYQIEGVDAQTEYELTIDAQTKETSGKRDYPLEADERNGVKLEKEALPLDKLKPLMEITNIALTHAQNGQAIAWELERELQTTYWTITVLNESGQWDVSIDAHSGDFLKIEQEN